MWDWGVAGALYELQLPHHLTDPDSVSQFHMPLWEEPMAIDQVLPFPVEWHLLSCDEADSLRRGC